MAVIERPVVENKSSQQESITVTNPVTSAEDWQNPYYEP